MKICTQCASPTNRPVKMNGEIICQNCHKKLTASYIDFEGNERYVKNCRLVKNKKRP